ncbi:MAG: 2,3-bisphosphoglycerate-independent phosphoglycerate mutase [Desulfobacterota bacterium]|nr:2,3-bisphosphoglycerate-independent phosphoglycerate mutase [Thermodesulfobacteriota bacterium]
MNFLLHRLPHYQGVTGPLLLIILDGMGLYRGRSEGYPGNAFEQAQPQTLLRLLQSEKIVTQLKAHGTAVGMPSDADQGNSEVGHNALGAGRIFAQGAKLVDEAIESRRIFQSSVWRNIINNSLQKRTPVHFIGLLSDGNVHSNINHLIALIAECDRAGVEEVYIHALLDGRDVPPISALKYFGMLEDFLWTIQVQAQKDKKRRRYAIASGGGRMVTTMDRYEADWRIVERGYNAHVLGEGPLFRNCFDAIIALRKQTQLDDQYLPPWVIADPSCSDKPIGQIFDDHAVIFFNFRGDRAIEITRAFIENNFSYFPRKRHPKVLYAGMLEYDGDTHLPPHYLVEPPAIDHTISEYLARNGISQYAISETQKYGHITYFWNGNNSAKFDETLETWIEIPSDTIPFDQAPAMKAHEIAEVAIEALQSGNYKFLRLNFANGDMVGHTGSLPAAIQAVRVVDQAVAKLLSVIDELEGTVIITADHGNCEQMIAVDPKTGQPKKAAGGNFEPMTSHTLNPVPFIIHGPDTARYALNTDIRNPGLANVAATILNLLGFAKPEDYLDSIIRINS